LWLFAGKKQPKHVGKMLEFWKKFKSEAWASAETFPAGETRYFAYPFHVADDTMPIHVHKTLCPFYTITKMPPATKGRNEEWQGGHNSPGAESLWGRQITAESAIKSQQCHKYLLQYSTFASKKISGSNMGAPNLLLAPGAI